MVTRSLRKDTFFRVQTGEPLSRRSVFTTQRLPHGGTVVSLRRDVYEAALEAAAKVFRGIVRDCERYKP